MILKNVKNTISTVKTGSMLISSNRKDKAGHPAAGVPDNKIIQAHSVISTSQTSSVLCSENHQGKAGRQILKDRISMLNFVSI